MNQDKHFSDHILWDLMMDMKNPDLVLHEIPQIPHHVVKMFAIQFDPTSMINYWPSHESETVALFHFD